MYICINTYTRKEVLKENWGRIHQPSSLVLNLFGCSEWNHGGSWSAVHTDWMRFCLSLRWPVGCEVLWNNLSYYNKNQHKEPVQTFQEHFFPAYHWGAEWSLCVCHTDAPVPKWCRWQRHFEHWGLHLPSEHEWGFPILQINSGCNGEVNKILIRCKGFFIVKDNNNNCVLFYIVNWVLLFTILLFQTTESRIRWVSQLIWEDGLYRPAGRPLWPTAESWVRKVPGWRLDWWRWHGHIAVQSQWLCLAFLRWRRSNWLLWGEEQCSLLKKKNTYKKLYLLKSTS